MVALLLRAVLLIAAMPIALIPNVERAMVGRGARVRCRVLAL